MDSWRGKAILLGITLLFCAVMLEVGLRMIVPRTTFMDYGDDDTWFVQVYQGIRAGRGLGAPDVLHDTRVGWRMRPGFSKDGTSHNSVGFRGSREYAVQKPEGVRRVMLLGDSFTYGYGADDDHTYGAMLQKALGEGYEVINSGVNSWGTGQQYLYYSERCIQYDPDLVVVGLYVDDFLRAGQICRDFLKPRYIPRGDELVLVGTPIPYPRRLDIEQLPKFDGQSRVIEMFEAAARRIRWNMSGKYYDDDQFEDKARTVRGIIKALDAGERARGSHVLVLTFPSMHKATWYDSDRIMKSVEDSCRSLNVPFLNLSARLDAWDHAHPDDPTYSPKTAHWTHAGNAIAAQAVLEHMAALGWKGVSDTVDPE